VGSKNQESCGSCQKSDCSAQKMRSEESSEQFKERQALLSKLCRIKHKIIVLSGKGGVGKSTVAANLALSLAAKGKRTGLLDVDIHGPSIPRMLGLEGYPIEADNNQFIPVPLGETLKVMSIGFLLPNRDDAVIWRGPLKMGVIKQFLKDVDWGELDYLVIDSPPGTGDEPLSVIQLIEDLDGAVIVTTPQDISVIDVRRSIQFCRTVKTPMLGVIENMSGFVCPHCGQTTEIFKCGGGEKMAQEMGVPFLGRVPLDPQIALACDQGTPYLSAFMQSESAKAFSGALEKLIASVEGQKPSKSEAVNMDSVQDRLGKKD
jgi:ATP-binding protein involved in chromosome partitioning